MLFRQSAFTKDNRFLKGALHVHTTRSDGKLPPDEALKRYEQMGYDFVALTDHRFYNFQNYGDNALTILPGMEMDKHFLGARGHGSHCFHTVCLGPAEGNGFKQDEAFPSGEVNGQEEYQPVLDMIHENNNLTILCHPEWSGTPVHETEKLRGNFAMELWNSSSATRHDMDTDNGVYWDYLLKHGAKLYGVAADDCHREDEYGLGFVYVNAENSVSAILDALKNGRFYASCGPKIMDFTVEDGVARLQCSPAARVYFCSGFESRYQLLAGERLIDEATYKIPSFYSYIRAVIVDEKGRKAWTNPIFLDERKD